MVASGLLLVLLGGGTLAAAAEINAPPVLAPAAGVVAPAPAAAPQQVLAVQQQGVAAAAGGAAAPAMAGKEPAANAAGEGGKGPVAGMQENCDMPCEICTEELLARLLATAPLWVGIMEKF
jgi:hypothetical protein